MDKDKISIFEKHPQKTILILIILLLTAIYGICSIKFKQDTSIKTLLHQYYVGKIIDNNVGRFIKLREHRPNQVKLERPTRNYLKNIAPYSIERKYYRVATDQNGFIGPSEIHPVPDLKIVFLGGSTTECLYMEEHERFPYLVGRSLEKITGKKVNSYNGGVSANESMHSINILLNKVLALEPNIVVLMHNINDLVMLRSQGSYWYTDSLKSHVQTAKNVFATEYPPHTHAMDEAKFIREFQRNLRIFIAICRIRDIQPVLMTQANRVENDPLYHRFNQEIRNVGKQEGVLVIDLAKEVPSTPEYLYDSYHFTRQGAQLAAETIVNGMVKPRSN